MLFPILTMIVLVIIPMLKIELGAQKDELICPENNACN